MNWVDKVLIYIFKDKITRRTFPAEIFPFFSSFDAETELFCFHRMIMAFMSRHAELKRGQKVCESGTAVTPTHYEGTRRGADKHGTQSLQHESHLKDLNVTPRSVFMLYI